MITQKFYVEKVIARGDSLDDIIVKTEQLQSTAQVYHKAAKELKWYMVKKNIKLTVFFAVIVLVTYF